MLVEAAGIVASALAYPTGNIIIGFSLIGLKHIEFRNFIGFGVCVKQTRPALCIAEIRNPVAIPTLSLT